MRWEQRHLFCPVFSVTTVSTQSSVHGDPCPLSGLHGPNAPLCSPLEPQQALHQGMILPGDPWWVGDRCLVTRIADAPFPCHEAVFPFHPGSLSHAPLACFHDECSPSTRHWSWYAGPARLYAWWSSGLLSSQSSRPGEARPHTIHTISLYKILTAAWPL
jgi:hypothetical protein